MVTITLLYCILHIYFWSDPREKVSAGSYIGMAIQQIEVLKQTKEPTAPELLPPVGERLALSQVEGSRTTPSCHSHNS
jgi:hypothetical protein